MNILIFDETNELSHLLKSILISQNCKVSFSNCMDETKVKINTALFDTILVYPSCGAPQLLEFIAKEFPFLPVILITDDNLNCTFPFTNIIGAVERPIKSQRLSYLIKGAKEYALSLEGNYIRKEVDVPVEIIKESFSIQCKTRDLTPYSMMLENLYKDTNEFHSFFTRNHKELVEAELHLSDSDSLRITGNVAFTDLSPQKIIRYVGLQFVELNDKQKEAIKKLLAA